MKITTRGRYALRIYLDIYRQTARYRDRSTPLRVYDICQRQGLPYDYAQSIITKLRGAKIMDSSRGPGGGVFLLPGDHTLFDLFKAVGENVDPSVSFDKEEEKTKGTHELNYIRNKIGKMENEMIQGFKDFKLENFSKMHLEQVLERETR